MKLVRLLCVVMGVVLLLVSCVSTDGARGTDHVRVYDAPFGLVQDAVLDAVQKSGFRVEYTGLDGVHIYSVRGIYDQGATQINMSGSRGRNVRSTIAVKVERLEGGRSRVEMSNPAGRANYGGGATSRNHRLFWDQLEMLLEAS